MDNQLNMATLQWCYKLIFGSFPLKGQPRLFHLLDIQHLRVGKAFLKIHRGNKCKTSHCLPKIHCKVESDKYKSVQFENDGNSATWCESTNSSQKDIQTKKTKHKLQITKFTKIGNFKNLKKLKQLHRMLFRIKQHSITTNNDSINLNGNLH